MILQKGFMISWCDAKFLKLIDGLSPDIKRTTSRDPKGIDYSPLLQPWRSSSLGTPRRRLAAISRFKAFWWTSPKKDLRYDLSTDYSSTKLNPTTSSTKFQQASTSLESSKTCKFCKQREECCQFFTTKVGHRLLSMKRQRTLCLWMPRFKESSLCT